MSQIYLIRDQHDRFLDKSGEWNHGEDRRSLFRSPHKDEAVNQMVELSVKNPDLRVRIEQAKIGEKGLPEIAPLPIEASNPKPPAQKQEPLAQQQEPSALATEPSAQQQEPSAQESPQPRRPSLASCNRGFQRRSRSLQRKNKSLQPREISPKRNNKSLQRNKKSLQPGNRYPKTRYSRNLQTRGKSLQPSNENLQPKNKRFIRGNKKSLNRYKAPSTQQQALPKYAWQVEVVKPAPQSAIPLEIAEETTTSHV